MEEKALDVKIDEVAIKTSFAAQLANASFFD